MRCSAPLARLVARGTCRGPRAFAVFASLVCLSAACAPSLSVRTGWEPHANFAKYRTWTWRADGSAQNTGLERLSRSVIARELARHGLDEVADAERPDLWCVVHAWISPQSRVSEWGYDMDPYGRGWGYDDTVEFRLPVGTMVVELVDRERGEVVWRARANDVIHADRSKEEREQELAAVVREMFAAYPPAPGAVPDVPAAAR